MRREALTYYPATIPGRPFINGYFKIWALILPVTSVLVFPSVQGTTPAYIMAFLSLPVMLISAQIKDIKNYFTIALLMAVGYVTLNLISQFILSVYGTIDLQTLPLVDPLTITQQVILRPTLFTQTLYLCAGVLTFLFVYEWYRPSWDPYIFGGIILLVAYGFYEELYFLATGTSGDFLSNRLFNERHSGSLFQAINIGGVKIQRMKSLTGEPSMFAFTVLPYWIFALHTKRFFIAALLTLALFLSTSTTAFIGIAVYVIIIIFSNRIPLKYLLAAGAGIALVVIWKFQAIYSLLDKLIFRKLTLDSLSGIVRFSNLQDSVLFWLDAPLPVKIFGLGFGYIRSTDFFSTLLVNNGLIGLALMTIAFGYPMIALGTSERAFGLKCALVVIAVTMLVSVPEFAYLPIWLFLGIAYNHLNHKYDTTAQYLYRRSS